MIHKAVYNTAPRSLEVVSFGHALAKALDSTTSTSSTSMHRVFLVQELMLEILDELGCTWPENLARLARTCKYLHMPSVRVLWSRLRNISPLIRLLPSDAWEIEHIFTHYGHANAIPPGLVSDSFACYESCISQRSHLSDNIRRPNSLSCEWSLSLMPRGVPMSDASRE